MKSLIAFLFGFALAVFLLDLLSRFLMFTLQPDYVRCDGGMTYDLGKMNHLSPTQKG